MPPSTHAWACCLPHLDDRVPVSVECLSKGVMTTGVFESSANHNHCLVMCCTHFPAPHAFAHAVVCGSQGKGQQYYVQLSTFMGHIPQARAVQMLGREPRDGETIYISFLPAAGTPQHVMRIMAPQEPKQLTVQRWGKQNTLYRFVGVGVSDDIQRHVYVQAMPRQLAATADGSPHFEVVYTGE